jgi:preprotein translocase subunit SecA
MAGRGTDIKLTPEVKEAGGLAIIGTERHESRRVDRQLRGRAGRQGDPGSSVFFVSLEDDLMRLFGSERIASVMDRLGFEEGEVIQHSMISKSIERAQKKVEENNFGIRKRLLEYDDVMNSQREVIYKKRRHALMGERIGVDIANMIYDISDDVVENAQNMRSYENLSADLMSIFAINAPFAEADLMAKKVLQLSDEVAQHAFDAFRRKSERIAQVAYPVIKQVYENQGHQYDNILIPITDGKRMYNIPVNLKKAYETEGKEIVKAFEKKMLLFAIDEEWKEHLRELDELRHSVQNATYEQKDPLLIYKLESYDLFRAMVEQVNRKSISILMRGQIPVKETNQVHAAEQSRSDYSRYRTQKDEFQRNDPSKQDTREKQRTEPIRAEKTVGRNDPCPCGSGKKYKNCHGK